MTSFETPGTVSNGQFIIYFPLLVNKGYYFPFHIIHHTWRYALNVKGKTTIKLRFIIYYGALSSRIPFAYIVLIFLCLVNRFLIINSNTGRWVYQLRQGSLQIGSVDICLFKKMVTKSF